MSTSRQDQIVLVAPLMFSGASLVYAALAWVLAPEVPIVTVINIAAAVAWGVLAWLIKRGGVDVVRWLMFPVVCAQIASQVVVYGPAPLTHLFLLTGLSASFLIFPRDQKRRMYALVGLVMAVVLALEFGTVARVPLADSTVTVIRSMNVVGVLVLLVVLAFRAYLAVVRAEEELALEHAKSERLLLNVLPASIAARLKERPGVIAERFESATILFADIVSFTPLAQRMQPGDVVAMLDEIFREFDALAVAHGLEKIKTIGDAYMAAAGIPEPCVDHARRVAEMALAMQVRMASTLGARYPELALRIGIATGPVVAGVIGERKFAYDLWGDAVNTASRMESHGLPGRIQVSAAVRDLLGDAYRFESRGTIEIKGKGPMDVYLLLGRRERVESAPPAPPHS